MVRNINQVPAQMRGAVRAIAARAGFPLWARVEGTEMALFVDSQTGRRRAYVLNEDEIKLLPPGVKYINYTLCFV